MLVCSGMFAMWGEGNKKVVQILLLNFWSDFKKQEDFAKKAMFVCSEMHAMEAMREGGNKKVSRHLRKPQTIKRRKGGEG